MYPTVTKSKEYYLDGSDARIFTQVWDNARYYLVCVVLTAIWCTTTTTDTNEKPTLNAWRSTLIPALVVTSHTLTEILYGHVLGPQTIAHVKRIQLKKDIKDLQLWGVQFFMTIHLCAAVGILTYLDCFAPLVVDDQWSWKSWFQAYLPAYLEFWILSALKDATSMHIIHDRYMHNPQQHPYWYKIHELHHSHTANLSVINGTLIHPMDLFFENTIGPFLLVLAKVMLWKAGVVSGGIQISLVAFLTSISAEGSNHSINPYSISYYCPPIDGIMKGNIAHNLHHIKKNHNMWGQPWHHLLMGGYQKDLDEYNKILKTNVQF